MKYEEWLNEWLVLYVKPTTKERTYKKYFKLAETHIIPPLGEYNLCELSPTVLQKFTVRLSDDGFSANTCKRNYFHAEIFVETRRCARYRGKRIYRLYCPPETTRKASRMFFKRRKT